MPGTVQEPLQLSTPDAFIPLHAVLGSALQEPAVGTQEQDGALPLHAVLPPHWAPPQVALDPQPLQEAPTLGFVPAIVQALLQLSVPEAVEPTQAELGSALQEPVVGVQVGGCGCVGGGTAQPDDWLASQPDGQQTESPEESVQVERGLQE